MRLTLILLVFFPLTTQVTQAVECLEPSSRIISRWKNGHYYKGEIDSITNRVNVLFDNGARLAYSPRDNVDIVVDRIPDHNELPWGSQILVNRPRSRAFEIGYIRDIKNGRFVILYENGDEILHTLDQIRTFNKSRICDEPAYLGCFRDNLPRDLQVYIPTHPATIGACVDTCKSQGYSVGALRNSDLCFCGNSYSKSYQVEEKECDMPCYDNSYEVCGGFMTFSQYWTGIVDSPVRTPPIPGMQKHFIPANHPIPWELLMHARSKNPSRYSGLARNTAKYRNYPWNLKGKNVALLQQKQQQPARRISNYPSVYRGKPLYLAPGTYQRYMQYYRTRPLPNSQPILAYGAYQRPAYRWPYNYNYNKYNLQNRIKNRPYNGYQSIYQRRPAPKPSPLEQAKLMSMLKKVSLQLFRRITRKPVVLSSPRFMGCFQDSKARDLPTEVDVRPLTVEGCVTKCGQSGFSMAGLQFSTQCLCGTTYSRYGRLRDEHCTMRCSGNYKEICGGFMMNSIYYTGVGQAIPYDTKYGPRTQKITFTTNKLFSPHAIVKTQRKPKLLSFKKPSNPHKVPPPKEKVKAPKVKDKAVKNKTKKPKQLKNEDKGRSITIQDYGKLQKILQSLSRWQQKPHKLRHSSEEPTKKPIPSYKDLRKILEDMTPAIVKKIAHKIIAGDLNRTRLSDMKPLRAVHSMEVNLAASKAAKDKDTGFKRINVDSSKFKNWSKKGSNRTQKVRKTYENVTLEADAQSYNRTSKNSAAANEKAAQESSLKNNSFNNGSQVSSRPTTQRLSKVQPANGNKISKLPSFIPTADKGNGDGSKRKPHHSQKTQDASKQPEGPLKDIAVSDVQSNKRNFVHFVITESKDDKKTKIPKTKIKPLTKNRTQFNDTEMSGDFSHYQVNDTSSVSGGTKEINTSQEKQTNVRPVISNTESSGSSEDVDEVFETYDIPVNNTIVRKDNKTTPKNVVKDSKKVTKTKGVGNKRRPQKVLHVEAKWNGQIHVKANWKDVDDEEVKPKLKKTSSVKRIKTKPKKTLARQKADGSSGEESGSEEYNFDDNGSRNDLIWKDKHPLKEKSK